VPSSALWLHGAMSERAARMGPGRGGALTIDANQSLCPCTDFGLKAIRLTVKAYRRCKPPLKEPQRAAVAGRTCARSSSCTPSASRVLSASLRAPCCAAGAALARAAPPRRPDTDRGRWGQPGAPAQFFRSWTCIGVAGGLRGCGRRWAPHNQAGQLLHTKHTLSDACKPGDTHAAAQAPQAFKRRC
jgi:hypothetical protein